jgi:hypothetical protein
MTYRMISDGVLYLILVYSDEKLSIDSLLNRLLILIKETSEKFPSKITKADVK